LEFLFVLDYPEDRGSKAFWNVCDYMPVYTPLYSRRNESFYSFICRPYQGNQVLCPAILEALTI